MFGIFSSKEDSPRNYIAETAKNFIFSNYEFDDNVMLRGISTGINDDGQEIITIKIEQNQM